MVILNPAYNPDIPLAEMQTPGIGAIDKAQGGDGRIQLRYDDLTSHMNAWMAPHPFYEFEAREPFCYAAEPTTGKYKADKSILATGLGPYRIGNAFSMIEEWRQSVRNTMLGEDGQDLLLMYDKLAEKMPNISYLAIVDEPSAWAQARLLSDGSYSLERTMNNFYEDLRNNEAKRYLDETSLKEQDILERIVFEEILHIMRNNLPDMKHNWQVIQEEIEVREAMRKLYKEKAQKGKDKDRYQRWAREMDYEIANVAQVYSGAVAACRKHMSKEEAEDYVARCIKEAIEEGEEVEDYLASKVDDLDDENKARSAKDSRAHTAKDSDDKKATEDDSEGEPDDSNDNSDSD
ncbi:MAG: hypothetical protein KJ601_03395 [Nanoarchaeota archaeon]|nr:hypothetical protein [Nanoarchaeota archaeon]MBU1704443.1 hypothetical protein [Nanoarchaeota archaeon]